MKKRQNTLGTYLALTAGVGCASTAADAAVFVVDLSGVTAVGTIDFPGAPNTLILADSDASGYLREGLGYFFGDALSFGGTGNYARAYQGSASVVFPSDSDMFAVWYFGGAGGAGFVVGSDNWVAMRDGIGRFGWLNLSLTSVSANNTAGLQLISFVYDSDSTGPSDAISLGTAVGAIPEPSSLSLLALGAAGLVARRRRKKAA